MKQYDYINLLSDKTKEEFLKWAVSVFVLPKDSFNEDLIKNMIIEWFKTVELDIELVSQTSCVGTAHYFLINGDTNGAYYPYSYQALQEGIEYANKLYNLGIKSKDWSDVFFKY